MDANVAEKVDHMIAEIRAGRCPCYADQRGCFNWRTVDDRRICLFTDREAIPPLPVIGLVAGVKADSERD